MQIDRSSDFQNMDTGFVKVESTSEDEANANEKAQILDYKSESIENESKPNSSNSYVKNHRNAGYDPDSEMLVSSSQEQDPSENQEIRRSILNLIDGILHVFVCKKNPCTQAHCAKLKWTISHSKVCKKRMTNPPCNICNHLYMLLGYHAHICEEPSSPLQLKCKLLRCHKFKAHFKKMKQENEAKYDNQNMSSTFSLRNTRITSVSFDSSTTASFSDRDRTLDDSRDTKVMESETNSLQSDADSSILNPKTESIVESESDTSNNMK